MKFADEHPGFEEAAMLHGKPQLVVERPDWEGVETRLVDRPEYEASGIKVKLPALIAMPERKPCGGCGEITGFLATQVTVRQDNPGQLRGQMLAGHWTYACSETCLRKLMQHGAHLKRGGFEPLD